MTRHKYLSDPRYARVQEKMDLLSITDVSTSRQAKNGTIVWKLPIKNEWNNGSFIEVASFSTGYVRNQNSGYSNYQLNKRCFEDEYYPEYKTVDSAYKKTGKYTKFQTKKCKLIPIEIERLEYLISYCLKNYYIKHANFVANGGYIPKWRHEWELSNATKTEVPGGMTLDLMKDNEVLQAKYDRLADAARLDYDKSYSDKWKTDKLIELRKEIQTLEENLDDAVGTIVKHETYYVKLEDKVRDLENKLQSIIRTARH